MSLNFIPKVFFHGLLAAVPIILIQCTSSAPEWEQKNQALIEQYKLTKRELKGVSKSAVPSNLEPGKVTNLESIGNIELYPGIHGVVFWGESTMGTFMHLDPNSKIPEEPATAEKIVMVMEGEIRLTVNGASIQMIALDREAPDGIHSGTPRNDLMLIEKGTSYALSAGTNGAKIMEVNSSLRSDYLQKAGISNAPSETRLETVQSPSLVPNTVYDLYDIQLTELAPGAYSRLISGKDMLLSFISMEPDARFGHHIHPEEQISMVLRGSNQEILMDEKRQMEKGDMVRIPGNMVHGAEIGEFGVDVLDIFWPSRPDYMEKQREKLQAYHAFIPEDSQLELVIDGKKSEPELNFTEGPKWMNGKLYFSNMYFDQDFNGDPKKSSTIEMSPDGKYRTITEGKMQTNGLYPFNNGNLIVCDMMGHRVVEMTTSGQVVRVLADKYDGKPIDGPNDVVTDAKGGFYFTDPQFTMEAEKYQPGRAVYYVSPKGEVKRITEPNEFAMPNGILLSPDGKTLYITNCYDKESWYPVQSDKDNYIWAYDVQEDGTISNGRQFAKVLLTADVLDRKGRSSGADGMAIDKEGNIYVASYYGVQIFDKEGSFVGMINMPSFPVSLCFGDDDMKTLYIVSYSKVFKIRTNKEGFVQYL